MSRVLFSTHAKAGSQWITNVLSDHRILALVPHVRFSRQVEYVYDWANYALEDENALIAPAFGAPYFFWMTLRSERDRAIRVSRDPRDTIISWIYSATYSHVSELDTFLLRAPLLSLDRRHRIMLGIERKMFGSAHQLRAWSKAQQPSVCHVTTYERIVASQHEEFAAMFDFLGWPVPGELLAEVVATHSFETRSGGRSRGQTDPFSHYRRGLPGDWRNHFDRDLSRKFEEAFPHLLVDLGYEDSDSWWHSVPTVVSSTDSTGSETRVQEISDAMAGALQDRDRRWSREKAAMEERCAQLERETENLHLVCAERLAVIQDQERHLDLRLMDLREKDEEIRRLNAHAANLLTICSDRLAVIDELTRAVEDFRARFAANERG